MSLRTVAGETCTPGAAAMWPDPTGWAVWMYSSTTARRMDALRSSSIAQASLGARRAASVGTRWYRLMGLAPASARPVRPPLVSILQA